MKVMRAPKYRIIIDGKAAAPEVLTDGSRQYRFGRGKQAGSIEVFSVLPGVELLYDNFSMKKERNTVEVEGNLLEINYCHEGRQECRWICGDYLYLGPGDLCITRMENDEPPLAFPTEHYRGITVILDLDILSEEPLPILGGHIAGLADKFCPDHHFFAMRANEHISHIFSELYDIPKEVREEYFQIKILELLMFLRLVNPDAERRIDKITRGQIEVIKAVKDRICEDLTKELTIDQLAREFCISPTALKNNFKIVYNTSIKKYLRKVRMEQGAQLLRAGNTPVAQIAAQVGYTNQSKFASAFKEQFGLSPIEYRKKCAHEGAE